MPSSDSRRLTSIAKVLSKIGARVSLAESRRLIVCDLSPLSQRRLALPVWLGARKLLYFLLNQFENDWRIVISAAPPCLLPDAQDHVIWKPPRGAQFLRHAGCSSCKRLQGCPGLPSHLAETATAAAPVLDAPKELVIEVTKRCNLKCRACFAGKGAARPALAEVKRLIANAKELGINSVRLTGGEPLLRPDLIHMLEHAKGHGLYVILNTNATLLKPNLLTLLPRLVDNVLVSIQGYDTDSARQMTGSAIPFHRRLGNIRRLVNSGIGIVRAGTIISDYLLNQFERYADVVASLGIRNWELYRPMLTRQELAANPQFDISAQETAPLCERLYALKAAGIDAKIANALPFCLLTEERLRHSVLLGALADEGHTRLVFDARGFFKASYFLNEDLGTNILAAWRHPFLRRINSLRYLSAACRACSDLNWCLGGSRFWARQAFGDYFRPDPWMPPR